MLSCTKCKSPLPGQTVNTYSLVACPSCNGLLRADVYPALYREFPTGHSGDRVQLDKEAGCFYHPNKITNLENQRTCYDTLALLVASASMLLYWFTILTAPFVIYLTVRHWNSPSSIIPRTKIRFVLAVTIAGLQLAVWIFVFSKLFF